MTRGDDSRRRPRIFSRALLVAASVGLLSLAALSTTATARATRVHDSRTTTNTVLTSYKGKRGSQLVVVQNGQKLSLYSFSKDSPNHSACNGTCAKTWYPLIKHGTLSVQGSGINKKQLKTFKRSDGSTQIEYYGQPLYRCRKNLKTGQIYGADSYQFGGSWGVMGAQGSPLPPSGYGGGKKVPGC